MSKDISKENLNDLPMEIDYAYKLGKVSCELGKSKSFNPYSNGDINVAHLSAAWSFGWADAHKEFSESFLEN